MPKIIENDRTIDLVHLARQSLGDRGLEHELLSLFDHQAGQILERLAHPCGESQSQVHADLAHTLKGSALTIGANHVATAAANLEATCLAPCDQKTIDTQLQALRVAVNEAHGAVMRLLAA